jgi:hypothetical protein
MKNLKDISVQSLLNEELWLNFDEEGLVNIHIIGKIHSVMSLKQWESLYKMIDPETDLDKLLWDHFEARFD